MPLAKVSLGHFLKSIVFTIYSKIGWVEEKCIPDDQDAFNTFSVSQGYSGKRTPNSKAGGKLTQRANKLPRQSGRFVALLGHLLFNLLDSEFEPLCGTVQEPGPFLRPHFRESCVFDFNSLSPSVSCLGEGSQPKGGVDLFRVK